MVRPVAIKKAQGQSIRNYLARLIQLHQKSHVTKVHRTLFHLRIPDVPLPSAKLAQVNISQHRILKAPGVRGRFSNWEQLIQANN